MKRVAALSLFFLFTLYPAFAGLGQPENAVDWDTHALEGTHQVRVQNQVRVHEITTDGQSVREYVSPSGVVFAISWHGIGEPNLDQIFGDYAAEYHQANIRTATPQGRMPKKIQSENLVVLKFGQMGNVFGKAYCPKLLPQGFNIKDIL